MIMYNHRQGSPESKSSTWYDLESIKSSGPLPPGEEYPRLLSPPPSSHSSNELDQVEVDGSSKDPEFILKKRNENVANFRERRPFPDLRGNARAKVVAAENDYFNSESWSDRGCSKHYPTIQHIAECEVSRWNMDKGGAVPFSHRSFQLALQTRLETIALDRKERILRGEQLSEAPAELLDFDEEFQRIYGPMDKKIKNYPQLRWQFKVGRLELMIGMMESENTLMEWILEQGASRSEATLLLADEISFVRKELEEGLSELPEATTDINPYTSPCRMDFFKVPRISHEIVAYVVRPQEFDRFIEFTPEKMFIREGYNAAILDVMFPDKLQGDFDRTACFKEKRVHLSPSRRVLKYSWNGMSRVMIEHPVGIEANIFIQLFRKKFNFPDSDALFDSCTDLDGIRNVSDIFSIQKLGEGENQKEILFHGFLEGLIISPKEILLRVWKRLLYLLQQEMEIEMDCLENDYKRCFGQPLYCLEWGFKDIEEFVNHSKKILPEELEYVEIMDMKNAGEKLLDRDSQGGNFQEEQKKEKKDGKTCSTKFNLDQQWEPYDGPIPDSNDFSFSWNEIFSSE